VLVGVVHMVDVILRLAATARPTGWVCYATATVVLRLMLLPDALSVS